jgi:hypothetical protein
MFGTCQLAWLPAGSHDRNELKFDGLSAFERSPSDAYGPACAGFRNAPGRTRTSDLRFRKPLLNRAGIGVAGAVGLPNGSRSSAQRALSGNILAARRGPP